MRLRKEDLVAIADEITTRIDLDALASSLAPKVA